MVKDLSYIVHQVMSDLQEGTENYEQYLQWAIFCCTTDINLKYCEKLKAVYLTMSDVKTVDFPSDMLAYSKIGICYRGVVINLGLNNNLCLARGKDDCGNLEEIIREVDCGTTDSMYGYYGYVGHFRNGQYVGEMYGMGGGFAGSYYRIDKELQQIVFTSEVPDGVILLEYKSSGIEDDGSMLVEQKTLQAIRAFVHWQRKEHNDGVSLGEKERLQRDYHRELAKLADMEGGFTASEYLDMHYRTTGLSPQR